MSKHHDTTFLIVDLFCGAGGTSTGFAMAGCKVAKVIAAVNHDPVAIESHWKNHPSVKHFEEDIRTLDLTKLTALVNRKRKKYPNAKLILWASLECTNFSKAKGGMPRDADSRTLAEHLYKYIAAINPEYIQIENVVEFMAWGPLDENGKPVSRKNGSCWMNWRKHINSMGYYDEWKEMNSADFGAYTSRNRLFGCFAKVGLPIAWPEPTHAKSNNNGNLFSNALKPWKPVKDVLDFSDEGQSIFNRKKPLVNKTLERIYAGLVKYVANGEKAFISKYYSGDSSGNLMPVTGTAGTITTKDVHSLVLPVFLLKYNSTDKNGKHTPPSLEHPSPVVSTQGRLGIVHAQFLDVIYGKGYPSDIQAPAPTLRTKDGLAMVSTTHFIDKHFGKKSQNQSINEPAGTVLPNDKHRLVEAVPFVMPTSYGNKPKPVTEPAPTIQASRRHHYLVNPSYYGHASSINKPCPVIIARQDKSPLYLITVELGAFSIPVYEEDSEVMIRIKEFMVVYGLLDIKMRMLKVIELMRIQGFPNQYKLLGTETMQKKHIGNSVVPTVVTAWVLALANFSKGQNLLSA